MCVLSLVPSSICTEEVVHTLVLALGGRGKEEFKIILGYTAKARLCTRDPVSEKNK